MRSRGRRRKAARRRANCRTVGSVITRLTISNNHTHTPFLCAARWRRGLAFFLPGPDRGAGGAPIRRINDRACEARLTTLTRRGSHRLQAGALASRRSAWRFRLRVPHFRGPPLLLRDRVLSPATATGQNPRGSSPPGRNLRGSAPRASSRHGFSPRSPRTPSLAPP